MAVAKIRRRVVASRDLEPGHVLTPNDLALEPPAPDESQFAPHHAESIIGRELQRAVKKRAPISQNDLGGGVPEPPPWFSPRPPRRKPGD